MSDTTVVKPAPPDFSRLSMAAVIEAMLKLRAKIDEVKKVQTAQLRPFNDAFGQLYIEALRRLNADGTNNASCDAGRVEKHTETTAAVRDWQATLDYIREKQAWELLEARVSKTAVLQIVEDTKQPIPGVVISQEVKLHLRKA